jgi:uncharacterized DUF497 family protein
MLRARRFRAANGQMRQLGFGFVDLALHRQYSPERDGDVMEYARNLLQPFAPAELPREYNMMAGFTHLFASPVGYGAGYYSYKWAKVLDADAFTRFREEGIFSRDTGLRFRRGILARGDSEDPAKLYRSFMGRIRILTHCSTNLAAAVMDESLGNPSGRGRAYTGRWFSDGTHRRSPPTSRSGIDFHEAAAVLNDPLSATFPDHEHSISELRFVTVGMSSRSRILVVVHTEDGNVIRIVSARRATSHERRFYEED